MDNILAITIATVFISSFVSWIINRALKTIPSKSDLEQLRFELILKFEQEITRQYERFQSISLKRIENLERRVEKLEDIIFKQFKN